jgi:hypothetical protein
MTRVPKIYATKQQRRAGIGPDMWYESTDTAGISQYRDRLYGNLYVMPIYDIQNRV